MPMLQGATIGFCQDGRDPASFTKRPAGRIIGSKVDSDKLLKDG